jgi:type I restriction enzyme S subunit
MMFTALRLEPVERLITGQFDLWTAAVKRRSTAGRGSSSKTELYGIKKLRELVLELAVRGLLVPQDPNDEPASELLKKIAVDKVKLVTDGKIKKDKSLPPMSDEDKPFDLPHGWAWARLGGIGTVASSSRVHQKDWQDSGVPFFRTREIVLLSQQGFVDNELFISEELYQSFARNGLVPEAGDLMFTGVGTIGVPYVVAENDKFYFKDASVLIFKNHFGLLPRFLFYFMRSPCWINAIHDGSMGTTVHTLTIVRANNIPIPIPPLVEQHRIVAKLDELMVLCNQLEQQTETSLNAHQTLVESLLNALTSAADNAQYASRWQRIAEHFDTLFTTEESINQFEQTILQLAVMGKLVPQDPNDESASELLKQIAGEKIKVLKEGRFKRGQSLQPVNAKERPFELPNQWERVRLGDVIDLISGQHLGPDEYFDSPRPDTLPYLTGPAEFGEYSPEATRYTAERRAIAVDGDILLTVKGSGVGKTNVVVQPELAISRQLMAIRPIMLDGRFLKIVMDSLAEIFQAKSIGIAIPGISREDVLEAVLQLPPLAEQHRIVAKVDEIMALCNQLKLRLNAAKITQLQLADALAEKALTRG